MTTTPLFLGLDVGTHSVRAALFDLTGKCHGYATAPLDTFHPQPAWAEQDAAQWWLAACTAVPAALAAASATFADVAGIGLDCTACTVLHGRRHTPAPGVAVDGPAFLPRGRRDQRDR